MADKVSFDVIVSMVGDEKLNLSGVTGYNINTECDTIMVEFVTGYRAIFNKEQFKYIIRKFDFDR